jgi:excisionase family DNA binding protein
MEQHDLMTSAEVAEAFRVSKRTVAKWCKSGFLDYVQVGAGASYRIKRASVMARLGYEQGQ